jgi:hypothetical protein
VTTSPEAWVEGRAPSHAPVTLERSRSRYAPLPSPASRSFGHGPKGLRSLLIEDPELRQAESKRNPQNMHHSTEVATFSVHAGQVFMLDLVAVFSSESRSRFLVLKPEATRRCCVTAQWTKPWNSWLVFQPHEQSAPQWFVYELNAGPLMMCNSPGFFIGESDMARILYDDGAGVARPKTLARIGTLLRRCYDPAHATPRARRRLDALSAMARRPCAALS